MSKKSKKKSSKKKKEIRKFSKVTPLYEEKIEKYQSTKIENCNVLQTTFENEKTLEGEFIFQISNHKDSLIGKETANVNANLQPIEDYVVLPILKNQNSTNISYLEVEKNRSWGMLLLIMVVLAFTCFFIVKGNAKSNQKTSNNSRIIEYNKPDATKLTCTLEDELEEGVMGLSKSIYIFRNNILIQVIDEESVIFNEDTLKYYPYYEKGVKEELKDNDLVYHNTILEMKKDSNSVGLIYSIDLTADSKNPNNSLELLGTTYDEAKQSFESEGYTCK